jgi:hypothetical protein
MVQPAVMGQNFWPEFSEVKIYGGAEIPPPGPEFPPQAGISALSEHRNFRPLAGISGVSQLQRTDFELADDPQV